MLIVTNSNHKYLRPKYWPRKLYKSWVVRDSDAEPVDYGTRHMQYMDTRPVLFGPATWYACRRFCRGAK